MLLRFCYFGDFRKTKAPWVLLFFPIIIINADLGFCKILRASLRNSPGKIGKNKRISTIIIKIKLFNNKDAAKVAGPYAEQM